MSWKQLLAEHKVHTHRTSKEELIGLRELIARDLADAAVEGLSSDRQFATAYNAALQKRRRWRLLVPDIDWRARKVIIV
jgi:hypothetical protein